MIALWLLVGVPLATGVGLLLAGPRLDRLAAPVAVAAAALAVGLAAVVAAVRPAVSAPLLAGIPAGLAVDGLSAVMVLTVTGVALAVLVFATGELPETPATARFFGLMLVFTAAMLVTVTATDLVVLLAGWEVMGAMSYALIGYWWTDPERVRSANLAFLTTRAGDLGLYITAAAALAGGVGTLSLGDLPGASGGWVHLISAGLILAAIGKSAQLPLSFWLSRAMAGPSTVSALLHSATMVAAGGYLLLRVQPLLAATAWAAPLVAWIGAATAILLAVVALAQRDLKQLLAASTCSQIGFIVLAAGVGGVAGGTLQLVAHAATKSLLFLGAGAWLTALGTKDLGALRGVARRYPVVGVTFTVGALSLAGLPPLSIWVAKDEVLAGAHEQSLPLYVVGLAAAVLSALYPGRALVAVWGRAPAEQAYDTEQMGTRRVSRWSALPLPVLATGAAALGLLALGGVIGSGPAPTVGELLLSGGLAVAGVAVVIGLRHRPAPTGWPVRWAGDWLGLERLAVRGVAVPTMRLARALAAFDDRVLDAGVQRLAALGPALGQLSSLRLETVADGAVRSIARGAGQLGRLARRPQTGQLHQYYAEAATVFGALVLVLLLVR